VSAKKQKPFWSIPAFLRHTAPGPTKGFAMLGMCLVATESDCVRVYSEDETATLFQVVARQYKRVAPAAFTQITTDLTPPSAPAKEET
jgi:hypothetical protein